MVKSSKLPKRFYSEVSINKNDDEYILKLDNKNAKTPLGNSIKTKISDIAKLVEKEWQEVEENVNIKNMPITRILCSAIDCNVEREIELTAEITKYISSDLLYYRAENPVELVTLQAKLWDPVIELISAEYHSQFRISNGISYVKQDEQSISRLSQDVAGYSIYVKTAMLSLTTISGSALIALAIAKRFISPEDGFAASELEHDYQASIWGKDIEATEARIIRYKEFLAASEFVISSYGK